MAKKKSNNKKIENSLDYDLKGKIILVCVVLSVLAIFYVLTLYITKGDSSNTNSESNTSSSLDNEILLGNSFSLRNSEYLVVFYDLSLEDLDNDFVSVVNNYNYAHDMKLYIVDMGSGLNKAFATDGDSNKNPQSEADLLINGPTLIKISNGTLIEYIEGVENIKNYLQ